MVFLLKFSVLGLSQLAIIKLGEQYKNDKVASCIQTFHINRWEITKIIAWKSGLLSIYKKCEASVEIWLARTFP